MSDTLAFFEATHGTAPRIAGKDMPTPKPHPVRGHALRAPGWNEAADKIYRAVNTVLASAR
jgi:isocitrate dehydrogenase